MAWACVRQILDTALVVPVGRGECFDAITMKVLHDDFEDNLILAAAREVKADFLVTSDEKLMRHAPVACLTPTDMAALLEEENGNTISC